MKNGAEQVARIRARVKSGKRAFATKSWRSSEGDEGSIDADLWFDGTQYSIRVEKYLLKYFEASDLWEDDYVLCGGDIGLLLETLNKRTGIDAADFRNAPPA